MKGLVQFRALRTVQSYKSHAHQSCMLQQGSITKVLGLMTTDSRQRPLTLSTRHTCHSKRDQEAKAFSMSRPSYFTPIFKPTAVKTFYFRFKVYQRTLDWWHFEFLIMKIWKLWNKSFDKVSKFCNQLQKTIFQKCSCLGASEDESVKSVN